MQQQGGLSMPGGMSQGMDFNPNMGMMGAPNSHAPMFGNMRSNSRLQSTSRISLASADTLGLGEDSPRPDNMDLSSLLAGTSGLGLRDQPNERFASVDNFEVDELIPRNFQPGSGFMGMGNFSAARQSVGSAGGVDPVAQLGMTLEGMPAPNSQYMGEFASPDMLAQLDADPFALSDSRQYGRAGMMAQTRQAPRPSSEQSLPMGGLGNLGAQAFGMHMPDANAMHRAGSMPVLPNLNQPLQPIPESGLLRGPRIPTLHEELDRPVSDSAVPYFGQDQVRCARGIHCMSHGHAAMPCLFVLLTERFLC